MLDFLLTKLLDHLGRPRTRLAKQPFIRNLPFGFEIFHLRFITSTKILSTTGIRLSSKRFQTITHQGDTSAIQT